MGVGRVQDMLELSGVFFKADEREKQGATSCRPLSPGYRAT